MTKGKPQQPETNQEPRQQVTSGNDSDEQMQELYRLARNHYISLTTLKEKTEAFEKQVIDEFKAYKTEQQKVTKKLQLENSQLKATVELMQTGFKNQFDNLRKNVSRALGQFGEITMDKTKANFVQIRQLQEVMERLDLCVKSIKKEVIDPPKDD